jgi:foldase protein PrsA
MKPTRRSIGALCAFFVAAALAAGCGDSVPGNSVATVDGQDVTRSDFDHWMTVFAKSSAAQQQSGAAASSTVPDPPKYAKCIKAKRDAAAKTKSKARPSDTQLTNQCKQEYTALRDQALGLLVAAEWLEGEAKEQGVKVTDAEVTKSIETQRKEQYPKKADFEKALKDAGFTMEDLRFQTRLQQLQQKLVEKISKDAKKPTAKEISDYYEKNKSQFGSQESRDLHIVLAKDKATADKAKQAIEDGESWSSVAKKYSTDEGSKGQGGKLTVT